jgi:hypothetical protein
MMRRDDIQDRRFGHDIRMVERQAVCDSRSAVVPHDREPIETEMLHDLNLVQRHGALGVIGMVRSTLGLAAVAISSQVGRNDGVFPGEVGCNPVPDGVTLRGAMQEQKRWTPAACNDIDGGP